MDLLDIPVVFICPDHNEKYQQRKNYMLGFLHNLGFKNVTMFKSGTEKYPLCLAKATYDILSSRLDDSPFLLLEDDVETTEWFTNELVYPENTDAFYFGFSKSGGSKIINSWEGFSQTEIISTKYIRILNMLSTHAILYVSKRYKEAVMNEMMKLIENDISHYNDVAISRIQDKFNIYGYHYPLFFQSDKFGNVPHVKEYTNFRFHDNRKTTIVTAYYPLKKSKFNHEIYMNWISNFFECVTADVICFCPSKLEEQFKKLAKPNHQIIVREFDSWDMMSESQMKIWEEFHKTDHETKHCPDLYAIWAAKQEFVRESINLTKSDIYVWCDIGCFREKRNANFENTKNFINEDKLTCLRLDGYHTFGGGVLTATKNGWNEFSKNYLEELKRNPHGKDQIIYNRILNNNNATIIRPTKNFEYDEWFYLTYLFHKD